MPSRSAIADMQYDIDNRQRLTQARLIKRLGLPEPKPVEWTRNPELARIFMQRQHVEFLESLDAALKDEGYTDAAGQSLADQKADQEEADAAPAADDVVDSADTAAEAAKTAKTAKTKTVRA